MKRYAFCRKLNVVKQGDSQIVRTDKAHSPIGRVLGALLEMQRLAQERDEIKKRSFSGSSCKIIFRVIILE